MIIPNVIAKGKLNEKLGGPGYIIMPKLDVDLATYLESYTGLERAQKVVLVIHHLIQIIEVVHYSNVIFNDIKPDNIMVNRKTEEVTLIDFGFASTCVNPDGSHIKDTEMN